MFKMTNARTTYQIVQSDKIRKIFFTINLDLRTR